MWKTRQNLNKIIECRISDCLSGYGSMYGAETWHDGRGQLPKVWEQFSKRPIIDQRSSRGQSALEMPYGSRFDKKKPWPEQSA